MDNNHKEDDHSYRGWLNSNSFLKRAFAVWGYSVVAQLIISIVLFIVLFVPLAAVGVTLK